MHVLVTHAFLRSLAKLNLATSKIGRLSRMVPARFRPSRANGDGPDAGDTPEREPVSSNQP